jgi:hypothetical protein
MRSAEDGGGEGEGVVLLGRLQGWRRRGCLFSVARGLRRRHRICVMLGGRTAIEYWYGKGQHVGNSGVTVVGRKLKRKDLTSCRDC